MRANLEGLGANEQWLCSKERSRLENTLLEQLRRDRLKPVVSPCSSEVSIEVRKAYLGLYMIVHDIVVMQAESKLDEIDTVGIVNT